MQNALHRSEELLTKLFLLVLLQTNIFLTTNKGDKMSTYKPCPSDAFRLTIQNFMSEEKRADPLEEMMRVDDMRSACRSFGECLFFIETASKKLGFVDVSMAIERGLRFNPTIDEILYTRELLRSPTQDTDQVHLYEAWFHDVRKKLLERAIPALETEPARIRQVLTAFECIPTQGLHTNNK
jgi:hypothetical protein